MKARLSLLTASFFLLSLGMAGADSFYVTNFGINTITKYDRDGNGSLFTDSFVNGPSGIALDASGQVYVSTQNNTIEKFGPDGGALGVFAGTGLSNPMGLAFDRSGNLFAANFATNTVEKFAPNGTDLGVFASVSQPTGLAFDAAGNLYVASFANAIHRFAPSGASLPTINSPSLNRPEGLAFDSLGMLYVANNGSNVIETFSPGGVDLGPAPTVFGRTTPVKSNLTQHVYISARSDGLPGNGTEQDPFDGSTQPKIDAIFKSFFDARLTYLTFHLGAGTFAMKGGWDYDWGVLSGWHIKGAGRTLTIIRQVVGTLGVDPGSNGALFEQSGFNGDDMAVEELTCDGAYNRNGPGGDNSRPHGNFSGIHLWGKNPVIRNVTVTGNGWQDSECFAILTSGDAQHLPDNALYENVEVSQGGTGIYSTHLTGMAMINLAAMGNNPARVYAKNGRIINCNFNLPEAGNAGGPPGGYESGIVTGSTFIGYHHGIFFDTFVSRNITIVGNTIKGLYPHSNGILFNAGAGNLPCQNISIVGNTIYAAGGIGFSSVVENSSIIGNRVHLAPGNAPDASIGFGDESVKNITVSQNTIDAGIPYYDRGNPGCVFTLNRTPSGAVAIPDAGQDSQFTAAASYGLVDSFEGVGLNGPIGLAIDGGDALHVVNSLTATVGRSAADVTQSALATTGYSPAFIAVQTSPRLLNLSTRLNVLTGDNVLAGGFIISGSGTKKVLVRGLGPSLGEAGVGSVLADPVIEVYDGSSNAVIASNDNWRETQKAEIQATGIPPTRDAEAALIVTLGAGAYTVIERGNGGTSGVGLLEIFDLDAGVGPDLANLSTRGFVAPGGDAMIAGFIAGSSATGSGQVMVRALGPSLGAAGVAQPLADPVLELHDGDGALVAANDNWRSDQQREIEATGIPPTNAAEAAILAPLAPGAYTAVVRGQNGGSGVGLVEVYNLR